MQALVMLAIATVVASADTNWKEVELYGQRIQSAIAKRNAEETRIWAHELLEALPAHQTTYYAGISTGPETTLTVGAAHDIIGTQHHLRINQWTRAAGEYMSLDRYIPGLAIIHTGEEVLEGLMEFGWSYRLAAKNEYPVYAHTGSLPSMVKTNGDGTYQTSYQHEYAKYTEKHTVMIDPTKAKIQELSRYTPINIILADRSHRKISGSERPHLTVKAHYVTRNGETTQIWGAPQLCEKCANGLGQMHKIIALPGVKLVEEKPKAETQQPQVFQVRA